MHNASTQDSFNQEQPISAMNLYQQSKTHANDWSCFFNPSIILTNAGIENIYDKITGITYGKTRQTLMLLCSTTSQPTNILQLAQSETGYVLILSESP